MFFHCPSALDKGATIGGVGLLGRMLVDAQNLEAQGARIGIVTRHGKD